jgi:hypothetical protein
MLKFIKWVFSPPDIRVWKNEEGLYKVTRIQTKFSFHYEALLDLFVYGMAVYFVINYWLGNFVLVWK